VFRPEFFSGFNFTTAQVVGVTAMINHKFISIDLSIEFCVAVPWHGTNEG